MGLLDCGSYILPLPTKMVPSRFSLSTDPPNTDVMDKAKLVYENLRSSPDHEAQIILTGKTSTRVSGEEGADSQTSPVKIVSSCKCEKMPRRKKNCDEAVKRYACRASTRFKSVSHLLISFLKRTTNHSPHHKSVQKESHWQMDFRKTNCLVESYLRV